MRIPPENFKNPAAVARFFVVCLIGLALDLFTKSYAFAHLADAMPKPGDTRPTVVNSTPGWVHYKTTINRAAFFGLGQAQKWLSLPVSATPIASQTSLSAPSNRQRLYQVILGML